MAGMSIINSDYLKRLGSDLYDLMAMNTDFITQEQFFEKYILQDDSIMCDYGEDGCICIEGDKFKITIEDK